MKHAAPRPSRDTLSDVRSQFKRWRRSRARGTRIPAALWQAAVEAAGEHGVSKTARALSLDYYRLKKRLGSTAPSAPCAEQRFVEIALPPTAPECVLELEDGQGTRLRVELTGASPAQLETLARTFWSVTR